MAGNRAPRRRRKTDGPAKVFLKAGLTLGLIVAFVGLAIVANRGVPGRDYKALNIDAAEIGSLKVRDRVAIGGVRVGQVMGIEPQGKGARIELQLEPDVSLSKDTKVRLRTNGLLGARYVQLIPGDERAELGDGATVKVGSAALTTAVPDALEVFNQETRGQLGVAVRGLGEGTLGRGEGLNSGIDQASDATVPFTQIMSSILEREGAARRLAPSLDSTMRAVEPARGDVARMLRPGAQALRPFADERTAVRDTLDVAPSAMDAAVPGLTDGRGLLGSARALSRSVNTVLPDAPEGLQATTQLLRTARTDRGGATPLQHTTSLLRAAEPAVPAALRITNALDPVLPRLDDALEPLRPGVRYAGRYGCDIINTGITLRSMTGYIGTGEGPSGPASQFRLQAVAGSEALGVKEGAQFREAYPDPCTVRIGHEFAPTPGTNLGQVLGVNP